MIDISELKFEHIEIRKNDFMIQIKKTVYEAFNDYVLKYNSEFEPSYTGVYDSNVQNDYHIFIDWCKEIYGNNKLPSKKDFIINMNRHSTKSSLYWFIIFNIQHQNNKQNMLSNDKIYKLDLDKQNI